MILPWAYAADDGPWGGSEPIKGISFDGHAGYRKLAERGHDRAGLELAIANGWRRRHEPGVYVKFMQAGSELFA